MKHQLKLMENVSICKLLLLPIYLYAYHLSELVFWIILMLADGFLVTYMNIHVLATVILDKGSKKLLNRCLLYDISYMCALGIIAFKSITLAGILLINEFFITFIMFLQNYKEDKK